MEVVLPKRSTLTIDETVITDEMIAIAAIATMIAIDETMIVIDETIDMMIGMGTTTRTKSHESRATATVYQLVQLMRSVARTTIRNDRTSGRTALMATTPVMETEDSTSRSFVTHLCRATGKVTNVMVATTVAVTTGDGETADCHGPGK